MSRSDVDLVLQEGSQIVGCCQAPSVPKAGQRPRLTDTDGHWRSYKILQAEPSNEKPGSTTVWVRQLSEGGPSDNPVIRCTWRPKR